jgi:putative transposase
MARALRVCRTRYYRKPATQQAKDAVDIAALRAAHAEHPFYGVERLALHLGWSEGKTRRIRNLAGVVVPTASKKHRYRKGGKPEISPAPNVLHAYATFKDPARPQNGMSYGGMANAAAWVQDFTYLKFQGAWYYLAVVLDVETRQILGWKLGASHSSALTYEAVLDALSKYPPPAILHSDQGSEYLSYKHRDLCASLEIQLSCSAPGKPWQNGFMERWFGTFKTELSPLASFNDLAKLHEGIAMQVYYYNTRRIHTALKMSPAAYAARLKDRTQSETKQPKSLDRVLQKVGG